jgi:glutamate---cysteine ligase / carboxylate-amine ligase
VVALTFNGNPEPTLGVELELCLVDHETRELVSAAGAVLEDLAGGDPAGHPKAKHELFESTVEIITGICRTPAEARGDLEATLAQVRAAARARGLDLMSAGTHPFSRWRDQRVSPSTRYAELVEELQWTARRLAIFGAHFHVGVPTGEHAVAVANALRGHLPSFLALSASSPFWEGEDSGLASARTKVFESLPTAGLNPPLAGWDEFRQLMDTLVRAKCIRSVREIWWDVRPHPDFGTVELRMCDAPPTLFELTALAALAQALVAHLVQELDAGHPLAVPHEWTVRENKWLATRHGTAADLIADDSGRRRPLADLLEDLVGQVAPTAARLGATVELAGVGRMLDAGSSATRQRAVRAAGGSALDVVDHLVAELATDGPFAEPAAPRPAARQPATRRPATRQLDGHAEPAGDP